MSASASKPSYRVWYQSFVDPVQERPYIERLQAYLDSVADDGFRYEVHGLTPPDHHLHALTELRCSVQAVRNAVEAGNGGYDAFVLGHFQEPGLTECKAVLDVPVVGLGETAMLHACALGRKVGLVTINPVFIPWHEDQIERYGLGRRVVAVRAITANVPAFMQAFTDAAAYERVKEEFCAQARPLLELGVEVIIPAGGLPMLLFARERDFTVGGAVVLNGIAVAAKAAETAVKLRRQLGLGVSRAGAFARPSAEALAEFLRYA